ncbi:glycosyltransferase family 2 protein [Actinomycetospora endophytica]|uniref:Glycosyltransferase family 2 protein n=1 Tax=Actinomycetospora endophytica TaxID=2291215 RepID=A0ABS8PGP9_9PSEU|nr:glycosyltransferase family 2 protein [Actinomycetospora endophytica]MCD2197438.1 glycosyltransferase family 2 protein [Actinomycetospora endophytica]
MTAAPRSSSATTTYGDGLAVVVVTYSPGDSLAAFLDSVVDATDRPVRTVLADNGSVDGVPEAAASAGRAELLGMGENLGYGAAANRAVAGLDRSVGWVLVSNPDIVLGAGALDTLLEAAERWPRAGSLGPLIHTDGEVYPSARLQPSLGRGIGHALFARVWPGNPWTRSYRQEGSVEERTAGWLSGSCVLLRREAWDSVDGFDPRYFMYFEDVDLGDRLGRAGWLNVYVPDAQVVHTGGHATTRDDGTSARMLREHHRSAYRFLADRYSGARWAPLRGGLRMALAARARWETRKQRA